MEADFFCVLCYHERHLQPNSSNRNSYIFPFFCPPSKVGYFSKIFYLLPYPAGIEILQTPWSLGIMSQPNNILVDLMLLPYSSLRWPFKSPLRLLLLWQLCGFLTMSSPSGLMSLTTHKTLKNRIETSILRLSYFTFFLTFLNLKIKNKVTFFKSAEMFRILK